MVRNLRLQELGFRNLGFRHLKRGLRVCRGVCWVAKKGAKRASAESLYCSISTRSRAPLPRQSVQADGPTKQEDLRGVPCIGRGTNIRTKSTDILQSLSRGPPQGILIFGVTKGLARLDNSRICSTCRV